MLRLSKIIIFGITLLGICGLNSIAQAHTSGKVHAIDTEHKHVVVKVQKPHLVPVVRRVVIIKKKHALLPRRVVRASLRH